MTPISLKGATCVVWMVAAGDQSWADSFIRLAVTKGQFPPELLTTWPLLQQHESGATVGVWLLVAAAEKQSTADEFIAGRAEMEPDCKLEIAHAWPSRPGIGPPRAEGFHLQDGSWLVVFPSPLMQRDQVPNRKQRRAERRRNR